MQIDGGEVKGETFGFFPDRIRHDPVRQRRAGFGRGDFGLGLYLLVDELCSEFVPMEKYFLPKPLKNTNMTLKTFWYFDDFLSNCLGKLGETWQQ